MTFDDGVFAAGGEREVDARLKGVGIAAGIGGVGANFLPAFSEKIGALDVVDPGVAEAADALQTGFVATAALVPTRPTTKGSANNN